MRPLNNEGHEHRSDRETCDQVVDNGLRSCNSYRAGEELLVEGGEALPTGLTVAMNHNILTQICSL